MTTPVSRARLVDELGRIKAELAPQLSALKELEQQIKNFGEGRYHGDDYEVKVYTVERNTLDMNAVRDHLSRQFIQAHTTTTESLTMRCTARQLNEESLREAA